MKTTLNEIKSHDPCAEGWALLLKNLGKTKSDDEPDADIKIKQDQRCSMGAKVL